MAIMSVFCKAFYFGVWIFHSLTDAVLADLHGNFAGAYDEELIPIISLLHHLGVEWQPVAGREVLNETCRRLTISS